MFVGEYLNGERNGKGKEYNQVNEIEFEGEYNNGKRWNGKGSEYGLNGNLEFNGEYKNGQRWKGILIEYDLEDGKIIFGGEIIDGEKIENDPQ